MSQLDQLMQALQQQRAQQQAQMIQSQAAMVPMEQKWANANTRRFGGLIPGLIETAVDAHKRKKLEPEYRSALEGAMSSAAGYDELNSQLAAIQQQIAAEEEMARKSQAAQAAGWGGASDAVAMGMKAPPQPKETSLVQNLKAMGVDPNSPEGRKLMQQYLTKGQTTYNVTPPTGYTFADPTNPSAGFKVIPGSPQEREMRESQARQQETASGQRFSAENVVNTIDRLKGSVGPTTAGWGGLAAEIPGSSAKTVKNDLNTVMANLAFDRLQSMRDSSKTGGALGQVSERELELLKSSVAGLEQTQDPEELKKRLDIVRNSYQRFIDALNGKMPEGYDEQGNPQQQAPADPRSAYEQWKKAQGLN